MCCGIDLSYTVRSCKVILTTVYGGVAKLVKASSSYLEDSWVQVPVPLLERIEETVLSNHYTMVARRLIKDTFSVFKVSEDAAIGVAVSGGADSSSLLLGLSTIYRGDRAKLVHVLTVDHQLQAETAKVSEDVARFAESLGFNSHVEKVTVQKSRDGAESDARNARYSALTNLAKRYSLSAVLLGHTKNDQAEQVFLGLLRGSGTRSLSGIPEQRGIFLRPFLTGLSREETEKICRENGYSYWRDPHNELKKYRRVALRKLISSVELETGQSIVDPLVRTAQLSKEDADALDLLAKSAEKRMIESNWSVESLLAEPVAIRKRLYRGKLLSKGVIAEKLNFTLLERIEEMLTNWHGQGPIDAGNSIRVTRKDGKLVFG